METRTARLFKNGASQAVRLPSDFRFEGDEVYATRDERTGDVTLSTRPGAAVWAEFFDNLLPAHTASDFMDERPMNVQPQERELFSDEDL